MFVRFCKDLIKMRNSLEEFNDYDDIDDSIKSVKNLMLSQMISYFLQF